MAVIVTGEQYYDLDGQLSEIKRQLRQPNGYPFDPQKLKLHLQVAIEGRFEGVATQTLFTVTVDYSKTIEDMVKSGRYDWFNDNITSKNFPTKRAGKTEIIVELVHFNRNIGTDEALKKLDRMGYRPVELHELLAFGEKYPEIQREFPIVALGSVWRDSCGYRALPWLGGRGSRRHLDLSWRAHDWSELCRFAAVRK